LRTLASPKEIKEIPIQSAKFATALAHEIRNPLTNINLAVDMLESGTTDGDMIGYLAIIKRSSVRINNLLRELLQYQGADKEPSKKYFIHRLLDEVLEMAGDRL